MWTREQLKGNAKLALRRYYWSGFAVSLVAGILSGSSSSTPRIEFNYTVNNSNGFQSSNHFQINWPAGWQLLFGLGLLFALILLVIALAYQIFVGNVIEVGKCRFFMESRYYPSGFSTLFSGFKGNYKNVVSGMLLYRLYIFLWSLLFVIPGIIKAYEYRLVPYLLAENPDMPIQRALDLSSRLTDGEKGDLFLLDLSFLGWLFLGMLACGLGVLFVTPYIEATNAELYTYMREKAFSLGLSDHNELRGFQWAPPAF